MTKMPSINQVAIMGQITRVEYDPEADIFKWKFWVNVYKEYGEDGVEANLCCGIGSSGYYAKMVESASIGDWVTVQGKIRTGGFIQVRSMCVIHNLQSI